MRTLQMYSKGAISDSVRYKSLYVSRTESAGFVNPAGAVGGCGVRQIVKFFIEPCLCDNA